MITVIPRLILVHSFIIPQVAYGFVPFLIKNRLSVTLPIVKSFLAQIRADEAVKGLPLGVAGFCWGGKHTVLLANPAEHNIDGDKGKPYVDAGFTGHPSMLTVPDDVEKMTLPVAFAIGDADPMITPDVAAKIKAIVEAKPESQKGELVNYPKCGHGFCVRADPGDVDQRAAEAEDQCIAWFKSHFKL
jgi:dienelactone hydrolase